MARVEGKQIDTLPSQMYGVQLDGTITKMAVDSDGKLKVSPMYFVENGNTLELWWNNCLVQSWTATIEQEAGSPFGLLLAITNAT